MPGVADQPPRKKQRRRHVAKKPSIYLLPEPIHLSIGKTLAASRIRYEGTPQAGPSREQSSVQDADRGETGPSEGAKRKQQAGDVDTDVQNEPVKPAPTAPMRGWVAKRLNEVAQAARMADSIGETEKDLPSDDLLRAVHRHAAELYTSNDLLLLPTKQTRYEQWDSKKRLIVRQAALERGEPARPISVESDSDEGRGRRGTTVLTTTNKGSDTVTDVKPVLSSLGVKRTYKKRDMRLGLDGSALLAFGMLVEELVKQELRDAGYVSTNEDQEEGEDDITTNHDAETAAEDNDENENVDEHENVTGDETGED